MLMGKHLLLVLEEMLVAVLVMGKLMLLPLLTLLLTLLNRQNKQLHNLLLQRLLNLGLELVLSLLH